MKHVLLFFVFCFLLVGCGPTAEQRREAERKGLVPPPVVATPPVATPPPPPPAYYVGADLGIMGVTGTVVRFVPENLEEGQTCSVFFAHIQNPSGYTKAVQVSRETWANLQVGDVIR